MTFDERLAAIRATMVSLATTELVLPKARDAPRSEILWSSLAFDGVLP
jgi:hypothetical protein